MPRLPIRHRRRRGAVLPLVALLLVVIFAMVAFAVDVGYIALVKTQLQRTADAAAHAAAIDMHNPDVADPRQLAREKARDIARLNTAGGATIELDLDEDVVFGTQSWNGGAVSYNFPSNAPNCVEVIARRSATRNNPLQLFFAPILGINLANVEARSIATMHPRDIVIVFDLSGSMHFDSMPILTAALNWMSHGSGYTFNPSDPGAGDAVMMAVWEDLGLSQDLGDSSNPPVPYPLPVNSQYQWDSASRTNNMEFDLPTLAGLTADQSRTQYIAAMNRSGNSYSSGNIRVDNGQVKAKMHFNDINRLFSHSTTTALLPGDWQARYAQSAGNSFSMRNYDFVIDFALPAVMQRAKPPLDTQASRDTYRNYWRGYVAYTRDQTSGVNGSSKITGFANNDSYHGGLYTNEAGDAWEVATGDSIANQVAQLRNRMTYRSYIQFMMNHGYNTKPGRDIDGNNVASSFTPMSMLFEGDSADAYRRSVTIDGQTVIGGVREQPTAAIVEGIIAALNTLAHENSRASESAKDRVAILVFKSGADGMQIVTNRNQTDPFTNDYFQAARDLLAFGGQSSCEGSSNVFSESGGTNTQDGLLSAGQFIANYGRSYTEKVVILFTDGNPNQVVSNPTIDNSLTIKVKDFAGNDADIPYYYTSGPDLGARNAALEAVEQMKTANRVTVHTLMAGSGRDKDDPTDYANPGVTTRMSARTGGLGRDGGNNFLDYSQAAIAIFEEFVRFRTINFALPPSE